MIKPTLDSSYEELVNGINNSEARSQRYEKNKTILEAKILLQSAEYGRKLNTATWVLASATIALVFATVGLLITSLC